jgi:predicted kinase
MWKFKYYDIGEGVDWDALEEECQWFRDMKDTPQDKIWHAEGDVQIHTKMVVNTLLNLEAFKSLSEQYKHIMVTAALMHDIEKRSTTTEEERNGRLCIVAPRHAQKGERTARKLLYQVYECPFNIREKICALVRYHGVPLWGHNREGYEKNVISASLKVQTYLIGMIAKADVLGRNCPDQESLLDDIEYFNLICQDLGVKYLKHEFKNNASRYYYLNNGGYKDIDMFDESNFTVVMLAGIAGAGKDTLIKNKYSELPMISLDGIRREMDIKPTDKKGNGKVYQEAKERCKELMRINEDFVFNATNISRDMRGKWINLFHEYNGSVIIEYIEVPYDELIKRNSTRLYRLPEKVIHKMINNLEIPFYDEAWDVNYNHK